MPFAFRYDAMVLFGEADEDMAFGSHLIQRCEDAGLKVFVPQRDLVVSIHSNGKKNLAPCGALHCNNPDVSYFSGWDGGA